MKRPWDSIHLPKAKRKNLRYPRNTNKQCENKERKVLIMSVLHVNKDNFDSVKASQKPVLLDFYADWCGPCRMVSPIVEEIAKENPQYLIGKINVNKEPELAEQFHVLSIPTLVVIKDGNVVSQSSGARPKAEILAMLKG